MNYSQNVPSWKDVPFASGDVMTGMAIDKITPIVAGATDIGLFYAKAV